MPPHKHKKKKKSHKRPKKHVSSSEEGADDDNSIWNVKLSGSDSEESKNEERLTSLARKLYVNHLKQALSQNFECWLQNTDEPSSDTLEDLVTKWTTVLEQKALRTCMISEIYRNSMVALIRQIKTSTTSRRLYVEEKKCSNLKLKIPLNKRVQTDESFVETQAAGTQTDPPVSSLLQLPLPKSSPTSRPYDPAIDFSESNSSDAGVSSSQVSKPPGLSSALSANQEVCNITSTSDLVHSPWNDETLKTDLKYSLGKPGIFSLRENRDSQSARTQFIGANCTTEEPASNRNEIEDSKSPIDTCAKNINLNCDKLIRIHKRRRISVENVPHNSKDNLDARLTALGFLGEDSEDPTTAVDKSKRSNWKAEEIAQSCNLTRILLGMSTRRREKVLKKFQELFGDEDEPLTELSEENISICRKRIATIVVMELTPIYSGKRIASRHLFKFLAKKITKSLMEHSLAPDSKSIRWKVKEFFSDGKVIMSESDCV